MNTNTTNYWPRVILAASIAAALILVVLPDDAGALPCDEQTALEFPEECAEPTPSPEPEPSLTPLPTPTPEVTPTPTPMPTPSPERTATPVPEPTEESTLTPTSTPIPTVETSSPPPRTQLAQTGTTHSAVATLALGLVLFGLLAVLGARKARSAND